MIVGGYHEDLAVGLRLSIPLPACSYPNPASSMFNRFFKVAIGSTVATIAVLSGCRTTGAASRECLGTEYLLVRNDGRETVDVVQSTGTGFDVIGMAPPGITQLQLASGKARAGRYFARRNGSFVAVTEQGRIGSVRFEVGCNGIRG